MPEETLTVVGGGNNSCNVSWGGGNGNNGGAGYSGKYGGTSYEGATSMLKLNDRVLIQLYLCNPLNPDYIGAPWGSDKDAESIIRAKEGANKQVISSQADSLIKISRIWADFFPANTS
ncbi:hypothetical protein, partial [Klebsiella pneumoniae]|uniref:hypothetical protein n=1 Tax=Klebsiella pneumoniae TaxID=573 RepID=UPI001C7084A5